MERKVVCVRTIGEDDFGMAESSTNTGSMTTIAEDGLVSVGTMTDKSTLGAKGNIPTLGTNTGLLIR